MQNHQDGADAVGEADLPAPVGAYRIGGVSRLTGVPVTTLRVWETRHAAFSPAKSTGRHRLYTEADVIKARLLRQLTAAGHSIGAIAGKPLEDLQRMQAGPRVPAAAARPERRITAVVVGEAMAARLQSPAWQHRHGSLVMDLRQVYADLHDAARAGVPPGQVALLLVRLNAVQMGSFEQLTRAVAHLGVNRVIVLYNFAAQPVLDAMRAAGMVVRREPVTDAELVELVRSVVVVDPTESMSAFAPGGTIPQRRFSDAQLARVAASPNSMMCECPRHIADLIGQLASFEEYSGQCLNNSEEDAHLHAYLRSISGSARALFEHALQLAAQHAGLPLDEEEPRGA